MFGAYDPGTRGWVSLPLIHVDYAGERVLSRRDGSKEKGLLCIGMRKRRGCRSLTNEVRGMQVEARVQTANMV